MRLVRRAVGGDPRCASLMRCTHLCDCYPDSTDRPLMPGPVVSIVVPTYRRASVLAACLDSIERTVKLPHEVVCVSVAGDDQTRDLLGSRNGVRIIEQPARGGLVQA